MQADLFGLTQEGEKTIKKNAEFKPKKYTKTFDPSSPAPFKLSRTKIENYLKCPRCFYLDRRYGVGQPPGFPFSLNSAVDHLLKKEFDRHSANREPHPLMSAYGLKAIPFSHSKMDEWRENFVGIQALHRPTNLLVFGAVDDLWVNEQGEVHVVDYKSTAKDGEVSLDADWQVSYKNQVEIYQWLLRENGLKVSHTAYFVYVNGQKDKAAFDGKLEFTVKLIPYEGDAGWVAGTLEKIKTCLMGDLPAAATECEYCAYREAARQVEN